MSLASWFRIILKTWSNIRARRVLRSLEAFWSSPTIDQALAALAAQDSEALLAPLARAAIEAARTPAGGASPRSSPSDRLTRALRSAIPAATGRLGAGVTLLGSGGGTAPVRAL